MNNGAGGGTYFLGRYRVVDEIGIGGMASVHLARMDGPGGFQKWVAIKRIHGHLIEDDSFVHMFLDEARVAARISHPNVANVFDLGKDNDSYWIAMEYLHGEPLREVMRRTEEMGQPMPPEIACRVIADAAEGLHAAHELLGKNGEKLGLVHRDVTPHNLFVTYDGTTKVVDFGIAKFSSRTSNTRAGTLKGKLAYMSPEQVHGEGIDRRTDIFALGVVLWELTTGQRLFRMESDLDTLAKVQECNVPRPSSLIRGYPIDLEKIVMKALAKNRGERFRTARELSRALQSLLMRRGLFIASDEVAAYVQAIFQDRIQKREAHLRWAADVTQTINLDGLLAKQAANAKVQEPSMVSFNSDVQEAPPGRPVVRPAAGMPAQAPPPAAGAPAVPGKGPLAPSTARLSQPPGAPLAPKPTPKQLASTVGAPAASVNAPASGPPRPNRISAPPAAPQHRETFRPPGQAGQPAQSAQLGQGAQPNQPGGAASGRLGAGMPQQARVQVDSITENDDGGQMDDGPTIQASVHLGKPTMSGPYGSPLGTGPQAPPTLASGAGASNSYANEEDDNEDATLVQKAPSEAELGGPSPAAGRPASARLGSGPSAPGAANGAAYAPARPVPARVTGSAHPSLPPVVVSPPGRPQQPQLGAAPDPMGMDVTQGLPNFTPGAPTLNAATQQGLQPQGYAPWATQQPAPANAFGAMDQMNMQPGSLGQAGDFGQPVQMGALANGAGGMNDPFGLGMPGADGRMPSMPGMQGPGMPGMPGMQGAVDPNYFGPPMMTGNRHEPTELATGRPKKANLVLIGLVCGGAALVLSLVVLMWPSKTVDPGVTGDTAPNGTTTTNTTAAPTTGGPFAAVRTGFTEASQAAPAGTDTTTAPPAATPAPAPTPPPPAPDTAQPLAVASAPPVSPDPPPAPTPIPAATPAPVAQNNPAPSTGQSTHASSSSASPGGGASASSGAKGTLTVICHPQCDQITDNGKAMGAGPLIRSSVAAGEHRLKLTAGSTNKMVSVIVVAGELRMVNQSMSP